jgi:Protein of unknown function (DUF1761)
VGINILAVVAAAMATFALGAVWYSPLLFAKQWVAAHGYTPEKLAAMRKGAGPAYAVTFACWVVMAAALALLAHRLGVQSALGGLKLGALCWAGFAATVGLSGHVFSERRLAVFLIDAGYQLVSLLAMGVIVALWR